MLFDIIDRLEPIVVQAKMDYMEKKLLSLKIMYYQKNDMREEYVKGVSRFYELVQDHGRRKPEDDIEYVKDPYIVRAGKRE